MQQSSNIQKLHTQTKKPLQYNPQPALMSETSYQQAGKMESEHLERIERQMTAGGHEIDTSQPLLPIYHRKLANPTPLGLFSFATGIFFISCMGVQARGVTINNMMIAFMIFYGVSVLIFHV